MTDATIRWIRQEIRHRRELLTAEETFCQQQPVGETRAECFRRINFWRNVLRDAEKRVGVDDGVDAGLTT